MPQESPTPISQGASPTFTPPAVNVVTPGRPLAPQRTQAEDFRDAILAAGQGVATAVSARSQIRNRIKALKEQSVRQVEGDLNRAARQMQARRIERMEGERRALIDEGQRKGPEWMERQFRERFLNSNSTEEADVWEGSWQRAQALVERDNKEERRQRFNSAARTMERVAFDTANQIADNPEVAAALTGDGTGIASRVQDFMLQTVDREVDLESMDQEDAADLVHQAVKQSMRISDSLRQEYSRNVEKSNAVLGQQQTEADVYSTLTGEQDPAALREQLEVTQRDRLSHLPVEQQNESMRQIIEQQIQTLAAGGYGVDAVSGIEAMREILSMPLNGQMLFTKADQDRIVSQSLQRAQRTVTENLEAEVGKMAQGLEETVINPDGTVSFRPNPAAPQIMSTPDPETGLSPIDEAANQLLAKMGLLDIENPTAEESLLRATVRSAAFKIQADARRQTVKTVKNLVNFNAVMRGQPGGNEEEAYEFSPERRAYMGPEAQQAAEVPGLGAIEVNALKEDLKEIAIQSGTDPSVVDEWNGDTLTFSDENREINKLMQMRIADRWDREAVQDAYGMPNELIQDQIGLLRSQNANKREAYTHFVLTLTKGNNAGLDNFVNSGKLSEQERAATTWLRTQARLGAVGFDRTGAARLNETQPDLQTMTAQVDNILTAEPVTSWMRNAEGTTDLDRSRAARMAEVMAAIVADRGEPDFEPGEDERFQRRLQSQFQELFLGTENAASNFMKRMWFSGNAAQPEYTDEQVGAQIWAWMEADGYRFREISGAQRLIIDPQGYTGGMGDDIQGHVDRNYHRQFSPQYRDFLQRALGVKPKDAPVNIQDLFMKANPTFFVNVDPLDEAASQPGWTLSEQITDRLLESRANYGGMAIHAFSPEGERLVSPVAVADTLMEWPDGTTVMVPKGTVLSVINPDLYAPLPTRFRGGLFLPIRGNPGITIGAQVPGQGVTDPTPFQ